ncbi:MAG: GNAT family N-acetyltransferase [Pontiellaceae bacterium]|nr:GNAT family N-acetyltransferase [Pontiellaceae bacterium]MBN2785665.1 GNAT family N-acetyltransferase [Pontiellaceae bacterium]
MLTTERVDFSPALEARRDEWDALLAESSRPTVYSLFDFVYTSCVHFQGDEPIFFLFMRDDANGELSAIFPLSIHRERCDGVEMRLLAHGITTSKTDVDKPYPIIRRGCEEVCWTEFASYVKRMGREWDMLDLDEFWPDSYLVKNLRTLFPGPRYWTRAKAGPESPIVQLDGDWDEFWNGHRKLRKHTRKLERKLGDNLVYKITSDPADAEECLNAYIATEMISWKAGRFVSHPKKQQFYHDLFPKLAAAGRLYFGMLYDRDRVISVEIAYAFGDRVYFAHGTYDPEYRELSPGTINSVWLIRSFHGRGFTEGDYLAGFAGYNNPWACRIEQTKDVVVRRMGWKNQYLALRWLARKLKRKVMVGGKPPEAAEQQNESV